MLLGKDNATIRGVEVATRAKIRVGRAQVYESPVKRHVMVTGQERAVFRAVSKITAILAKAQQVRIARLRYTCAATLLCTFAPPHAARIGAVVFECISETARERERERSKASVEGTKTIVLVSSFMEREFHNVATSLLCNLQIFIFVAACFRRAG